MESFEDFRNKIKNIKGNRIHKLTHSVGVIDGFYYYRKNRPKDKKYVLDEKSYLKIIRTIGKYLAQGIIENGEINFPCKMGKLEIRKGNIVLKNDGKKIITKLPVNWDATLKLWYEDKESYNNKTLIYVENRDIYKLHYNKIRADYKNKSYFQFFANRNIKNELKKRIKEGNIDAFKIL